MCATANCPLRVMASDVNEFLNSIHRSQKNIVCL